MERIVVTAHFHTAHRQLGYPGHCRFVHGHTWRGKIIVQAEEFPRDAIDQSLDFGDLKKTMRRLDHKLLVSAHDHQFLNSAEFEPEGIVVLDGRGPSVENVALDIFRNVVAHIGEKFPGRGVEYTVAVEIQETDNNFFAVERKVRV